MSQIIKRKIQTKEYKAFILFGVGAMVKQKT